MEFLVLEVDLNQRKELPYVALMEVIDDVVLIDLLLALVLGVVDVDVAALVVDAVVPVVVDFAVVNVPLMEVPSYCYCDMAVILMAFGAFEHDLN